MPRLALILLVGSFAASVHGQGPAATAPATQPRLSFSTADIFTDNMVLQRQMPVPIWGKARPGEELTVRINGQTKQATATADGRWMAKLDELAAGGPHELVISNGRQTLRLGNILVGEVWLAAGQSNMDWRVNQSADAEQEIAAADWPQIRISSTRISGRRWVACSPANAGLCSATAYYFARELHRSAGVPVGIIVRPVVGTALRQWTPRDPNLLRDRSARQVLADWLRAADRHAADMKLYAQWQQEAKLARAEGRPVGPSPVRPLNPGAWGNCYESLIVPLMPAAIRGVIWYQGEAEARSGRHAEYAKVFPSMVLAWREAWAKAGGDSTVADVPFLYVQLANDWGGRRGTAKPSSMPAQPVEAHTWPWLREAQASALSLPNTAMAITIDIGGRMHPLNKQDVGRRLALLAEAKVYGRPVVDQGPTFAAMAVEQGKARIRFGNVGGGLRARDGERLLGFAIAGGDQRFAWAQARIEGETVVVWADDVAQPVAVRYGWLDDPRCNLHNAEGLPAAPFRTDTWPAPRLAPEPKRDSSIRE